MSPQYCVKRRENIVFKALVFLHEYGIFDDVRNAQLSSESWAREQPIGEGPQHHEQYRGFSWLRLTAPGCPKVPTGEGLSGKTLGPQNENEHCEIKEHMN